MKLLLAEILDKFERSVTTCMIPRLYSAVMLKLDLFKIMTHETSNVILKSFLMVTCTFSGTSCGTGVPDSKSPATEPVFTWSKYREETRVTKAETDLNTQFHCNVKYKQSFA